MIGTNIAKKLECSLLEISPNILELLKDTDLSEIETKLGDLLQEKYLQLLQMILQEVLNNKTVKKNCEI